MKEKKNVFYRCMPDGSSEKAQVRAEGNLWQEMFTDERMSDCNCTSETQ